MPGDSQRLPEHSTQDEIDAAMRDMWICACPAGICVSWEPLSRCREARFHANA